MNEKRDFRYDPLYRVMDVTEEIRFVEGNFKRLFDRLKGINNLGIIPEVLEMARYPKYEHHLGTVYQIYCLLDCVNEDMIPDRYRFSLKLSALFSHVGHLPFTYSTERALLLASGLGSEERGNKAKKYVKKRIGGALRKINFDDEKRQEHLEKLFSLEKYRILYRYFSSEVFLKSWLQIRNKYGLKNEQKMTIVKNLIDSGIPVVIAPQTIFGRIDMNVYTNGRLLNKIGVIGNNCDWLPEVAWVKLAWVLGHTKNLDKVKEMMLRNYVGEISERVGIEHE